MLNIGIIGPGRVAERHANALKMLSSAQLWSVVGRKIEDAKTFAVKYDAVSKINAYDNLHAMLNDPNLHAVIIATPDKLHADQVILAAKAGKAILIEKPLCTSLEEGERILSAVQKNQIPVAIGYHMRWHQGLRAIAQKIRENELGDVHYIRFCWGVDFIDHAKWRTDFERGKWFSLTVLGTHLIDMMRWFMVPIYDEPISQKSLVVKLANTHADKSASISFQFKSGAIVDMFFSIEFNMPLSLKIHATQSIVHGNHLAGLFEQQSLTINDKKINYENGNFYVDQLSDFIAYINGKKSPEVSLEEGLKNVNHLISASG